MRIGVLTSSRADYSIYLPLLKKIKEDPFFNLGIIAFGTHNAALYGNTVNAIRDDGFTIDYVVDTLWEGDSAEVIASVMGTTMLKFAPVWASAKYDLVFALGDRYEMFSAVAAATPFNLSIAHIHGGETTLGAIDDSFRHSITLMSKIHFPVTEKYKQRIIELKGEDKNVYNVGSLSYDNLKDISLLSIHKFKEKYNIDLSVPSVLITFHPETVSFEKNEIYISELLSALQDIKEYQLIITMPNADTTGNMIRKKIENFIHANEKAIGVESFGTLGYLSCMKHCAFMLGNTSSGFAEAAFFPKYVINLGERQRGRIVTPNIRNCVIEKNEILNAVNEFKTVKLPGAIDIYGKGNAAEKIVQILKDIHG